MTYSIDQVPESYRPYAYRNAILAELGYQSYTKYLMSPVWTRIRLQVFKRHGGQCYVCHKTATEIHHKSYTVPILKGEELGYLVPLCRRCHHFIEFEHGEKRRLKHANLVLKRMYRKRHPKLGRHGIKAIKRYDKVI